MTPDALAQIFFSLSQIHRQEVSLEERRVQLKALEMQIDYRNDRMNAQASLTRDLIRSLIDRRIDATESGFRAVLAQCETQNNNYVELQTKLIDAKIKSVDPLERANLDASFNEIAIQLVNIQIQGRSLYHDMNCVLLAIGGTTLEPATEFQRNLSIERETTP